VIGRYFKKKNNTHTQSGKMKGEKNAVAWAGQEERKEWPRLCMWNRLNDIQLLS